LILQPLIENAIKHGVARSTPPTFIRVGAGRDGERLALEVINGGTPSVPLRTSRAGGIGLVNVRERLAEYYGPAQSMSVTADGGTFDVRLTLPLREAA
jgi:sensor histidine kinase YesM